MPKLCPVCGTSYPDTLVFCPADATTLRAADVQGDLIGSVVADRYLVTDLLGEGGMGTVYLARHVRLPQQAAIKVLRKDMLRDAGAIARFNREAANASRIDHDRVARVYDFGETDDGVVYLAMEYIQGKTLKSIIAESGLMAPPRVARLVRQIAEALDAAHRMEIVHRDLKPDNIMVIEDADGAERVKVVDFGIAKAFGNEQSGAGLTKTGFIVGTPEFMSPEQLLGGTLDARSDLYALAIVAYQCLTGELPFNTNTPDHGMAARLMTPPRSLLAVSPMVRWPVDVQTIFDQALARDPEERQTTAGVFAKSLAAALDRWQTGDEHGDGRTNVGRRASERGTLAGTAAAPAVAAPAVVTAPPVSAPTYTPYGGAPAVPAPAPTKRGMPMMVAGIVLSVAVIGAGGFYLTKGRSTPSATSPAAPPVASASVPNAAPALPEPHTQASAVVPNAPTSGSSSAPAAPVASTPVRVAGMAPSSTVPVVPAPQAPSRAGATSGAGALAAKRTLDSLTNALDPANPDEAAAHAAIPVLRGLLPRLASAEDSTWAEIRLAEAHLLVSDSRQACVAIRIARTTARSKAQRDAVQRYDIMLSCGDL